MTDRRQEGMKGSQEGNCEEKPIDLSRKKMSPSSLQGLCEIEGNGELRREEEHM